MEIPILYLFGVTVALVGGILLLLFAAFSAYIFYLRRKFAHIPGPPPESFFLGNIPTMKKLNESKVFYGYKFEEWVREYGGVIKLQLLHMFLIVPSTPKIYRDLLTTGKYPKSKPVYKSIYGTFGSRFMGTGLITNIKHAEWYKRRHTMNEFFQRRSLSRMMDKFNDVADDWMFKLDELVDGPMFQMQSYTTRATVSAICKVGFGLDVDAINNADFPFCKAINKTLEAHRVEQSNPVSKIHPSFRQLRRESRDAASLARDFGKQSLLNRRHSVQSGDEDPRDLLSNILKLPETVPHLEMDDLVDEFDTFFLAGSETTANTLAFMFNIIGQRPDIAEKIYEEVDRVLGTKEEATWDDLSKLQYLNGVMKETLRIYPVAPGTVRTVTKEETIDGVRFPSGSDIYLCAFIMHRMEKYYQDPLVFNPERWLAKDYRPPLYTYMPFSLGPRICAGQHFAQIEMKLFMARFFQRFEYTLDPHQDFTIQDNTTLSPRDGARMTLRHRTR